MVTTLGHLVAAAPILARLATQPRPVVEAYTLFRLWREVEGHAQDYERQRGAAVVRVGATRDAATDQERETWGPRVLEVPPAAVPGFVAEMLALAAVTVEVTHAPIALGGLLVSATDLHHLGTLVTE